MQEDNINFEEIGKKETENAERSQTLFKHEDYESWKNVNSWLIPSWKSVRKGMETPYISMGFRVYDTFYTTQKLKIYRFCLL